MSSIQAFCYRAHQHLPVDGEDDQDHHVDRFFDTETPIDEIRSGYRSPNRSSSPPLLNDSAIKEEFMTPAPNESFERRAFRRRSLSVHSAMQTVTLQTSDVDEMTVSMKTTFISNEAKENCSMYRIRRDNSREMDSEEKKLYQKSSSQSNIPKYVSLAEAIYHMQKDTPERFHSTSRKLERRALKAAVNRKKSQKPEITIPQSPALLSKTRSRKTMFLSQKEMEDLELAEIQKHKIKANPIPKSVLLGGLHLPPVPKRPVTHPEPFKLSQIRKKPVPMPARENVAFTARPVPKCVTEKPREPIRNVKPLTQPATPKFHGSSAKKLVTRSLENVTRTNPVFSSAVKNKFKFPFKIIPGMENAPGCDKVGHAGVPIVQKPILHPCKPQPFSFEQRDKERMMKKEMEIKRFLEKEKKMREFHANPIPPVIKKIATGAKTHPKENKENVDNKNEIQFKARKALVLTKAPFIPAKAERPVLAPCPLQLATEARASKRDEFDQKIRKNEEIREMHLKQAETEQKLKEDQETAELRQKLVHKANPVRKFTPVRIERSNAPLTIPATPKFSKHRK